MDNLSPAGQQIFEQFKAYARSLIEAGKVLRYGDDSDAGGFKSISVLARHYASLVLDGLLQWRKEQNQEVLAAQQERHATTGAHATATILQRLVVESIFLKASLVVLGGQGSGSHSDTTAAPLPPKQADSLQSLAFSWVINAERYVPGEDLAELRGHVTTLGGHVIAAIARDRLPGVLHQFLKELARISRDPAGGMELRLLCDGMRAIRLRFRTPEDLAAATEFLRQANPMAHKATGRRSGAHYFLSDMLRGVLGPTVEADEPRCCGEWLGGARLREWEEVAGGMLGEVLAWTLKATTHQQVGFPLVVHLLAQLGPQEYDVAQADVMDQLHRLLKPKEWRGLALSCLLVATGTFLCRYAGPEWLVADPGAARQGSGPQQQVDMQRWLDNNVAQLLLNYLKGNLKPTDQQETLLRICQLTAYYQPPYALTALLPDLLRVERAPRWEAAALGLRMLHSMVDRALQKAAGVRTFYAERRVSFRDEGEREAVARSLRKSIPQILDLERQGMGVMEVYRVEAYRGHVAALLQAQYQAVQPFLTLAPTSARKTLPKAARDNEAAKPAMAVLTWLLKLAPFFLPSSWQGEQLPELLTSFTTHHEVVVQQLAAQALRGVLRGMPAHRGGCISSYVALYQDTPDSQPARVGEVLAQMTLLLRDWLGLL